MARQISDSVLDAILGEDPNGRVMQDVSATGLVRDGSEVSTTTYVDASRRSCGRSSTSATTGPSTASTAPPAGSPSPSTSSRLTSPRVSFTPSRSGRSVDPLDAQGAGDQGMMVGYAVNETPELMPLPIALAHRLSRRLAADAQVGRHPYRLTARPRCVEYERGKPVRLDTVVVSTQHGPDIDLETLLAPDIREHVIDPDHSGRPRRRRAAGVRQPDRQVRAGRPARRHRPDPTQDHRRYLRWRRPPRRRRLRPGRTRRRWTARPRTRPAGWPRTSSPPGSPTAARSRSPTPSATSPTRSASSSRRSAPRRSTREARQAHPGVLRPAPGRDHPRPGPAPADLQGHRGLRPLRPDRGGLHLVDPSGRGTGPNGISALTTTATSRRASSRPRGRRAEP